MGVVDWAQNAWSMISDTGDIGSSAAAGATYAGESRQASRIAMQQQKLNTALQIQMNMVSNAAEVAKGAGR